MLTLEDTLAVIINKVKNELKDCSVSSQDITEEFERKTIYIYFDDIKASDYMKKFVEKNITIRMIYFPSNDRKNTFELLNVQDRLIKIFTENDVIKLADGIFANIEEIEVFRHEGTLHFNCDAYIFEEYDKVEHELMGDLIHKGGIE